VTAYDLGDTTAMVEFTGKMLGHDGQNQVESELGEWSINTFSGTQGSTTYEIRDCYRTLGPAGLHVRLAFPKLSQTTKEWTDRLEAQFKQFLEQIETKAAK
jgi:hypothetical protein